MGYTYQIFMLILWVLLIFASYKLAAKNVEKM